MPSCCVPSRSIWRPRWRNDVPWRFGAFPEYVPVAERRAKALAQARKLEKRGRRLQPIALDGRRIASSFWGKAWCDNLESYSDFANRLPRGRTYVRNGVGARFDKAPETFFTLRSLALDDLVAKSVPQRAGKQEIADSALESIFGIELDRRR